MRFGNNKSVNDCISLAWIPSDAGSTSNYLAFNPYGASNALVVRCDGKVGIGLSNPRCPLEKSQPILLALHLQLDRDMVIITGLIRVKEMLDH